MPTSEYMAAIVECFEGIPGADGRLAKFHHLYNRTCGIERTKFIEAIGKVIETSTSAEIVYELVVLVAIFDLAQVDAAVRSLETRMTDFPDPAAIKRVVEFYYSNRADRESGAA